MDFTDLHFELHVNDLEVARSFYVDQLALPILQDTAAMNLLAVKVGKSRMSIFGGGSQNISTAHSQIILAVTDIEKTVSELQLRGITVSGPPVTAGTFLKFITITDPEGNVVGIAEYLRDPISPI